MFEGIYFQFPKLGFLLFFYLACASLCPLRSAPLYFPRPAWFERSQIRPPVWMWLAKWTMISMLIIALMSPVREISRQPEGENILLIVDQKALDKSVRNMIGTILKNHVNDRFALYVPGERPIIIPMTQNREAVLSIVDQIETKNVFSQAGREIERFFPDGREGRAVIFSDRPKEFVRSIPVGLNVVVLERTGGWKGVEMPETPKLRILQPNKYFEFYYIYPLFIGFLAMLAYLFGRNQKGLK